MAQLPFSFSLVGGWFYGTSLSLYIYRATSLWEFCVWRYQTGCEWHKTRTHKTAYLHSCSSLKRKKMYLSLASEFWVLLLDSSNLDLRLVHFCGLKMEKLALLLQNVDSVGVLYLNSFSNSESLKLWPLGFAWVIRMKTNQPMSLFQVQVYVLCIASSWLGPNVFPRRIFYLKNISYLIFIICYYDFAWIWIHSSKWWSWPLITLKGLKMHWSRYLGLILGDMHDKLV